MKILNVHAEEEKREERGMGREEESDRTEMRFAMRGEEWEETKRGGTEEGSHTEHAEEGEEIREGEYRRDFPGTRKARVEDQDDRERGRD